MQGGEGTSGNFILAEKAEKPQMTVTAETKGSVPRSHGWSCVTEKGFDYVYYPLRIRSVHFRNTLFKKNCSMKMWELVIFQDTSLFRK